MYLKSLSLYGFKTFANKLDFQFKPGCTAIVGPNGSGKSNLIDAIIWVMGEQSARSIRGRKMEEVIFHGSTAKKPLGYAQVVLTFDNEDGFFPLPHSEVSIMRRYYKSGESEFAINREPCRLRDIQSLLMDTGLGMMNYSVISQGDVEYIIDLSPVQRRQIFDEAAGINRYKMEKDKTLQKIRETDSNIARLRDILTEIEETLEPLRIQADKAKRHDELTEQIEKLKLSVIVSDIVRLTERLSQLAQEDVLVNEKNRVAEAAIKEFEKKLEELAEQSASSRAVADEKMEELASIGGEVGRAEESIRGLSDALAQVVHGVNSFQDRKKSALSRIEQISAGTEEIEKNTAAKIEELARVKEERRKFTGADADGFQEQERKLSEICSELRGGAQNLRSEETRLRNEQGLVEKQLASIERETANRSSEKSRLEQNISALKAKLDSLLKEEKTRTAELEKLRQEKTGLDVELPGLLKELDKVKSQFNTVGEEERELRARIKALEKVAIAVETLYSSAIGIAKTGKGDRTTFGAGVEVGPEFTRAAGRALGDILKAGVVKSAEIQDLPAGETDRASIYLLSDWFSKKTFPEIEHLKSKPGVIGILEQFVNRKSAAEFHGESVFKRVLVTDSLKSLLSLVSELPAGAVAVTRDGNAVFLDGVLKIGEDLVTPDAVSEKLNQARRELEEKSAKAAELRKKLEEKEKTYRSKKNRNDEIAAHIQKLEASAGADGERKRAFNEQMEMYAASMASLDAALSGAQPQKDELSAARAKAEKELARIRESLTADEAALKQHEADLKKVAEEIRRLRASQAEMDSKMDSLQREIDELKSRRNSIDMEMNQLRGRIDDADHSLEGLLKQKGKLETDLSAGKEDFTRWAAKKKEMQAELDALKTSLNAVAVEMKDLAAEIEKEKEELAAGKESLLQSEVKKARMEAQLDEVRKHFEEEFPGLSEERAVSETAPPASGEKGLFKALRDERESLMPVNHLAIGEFEEKKNRYDVLMSQIADLEDARSTLLEMVDRYDDKSRGEFLTTFHAVQEKFSETFVEVFQGGEARIVLTDEENPLESGVDIKVQVPGQRMRHIGLLSGGQKALCAMTLIFSILKVKPSPFYLLDEVDAGLDEVNVSRFKDLLIKYSKEGQFIVITHNKGTLAGADHFYGITLEQDEGYSKVISVSLE